MIVYQSVKSGFLEDVLNGDIDTKIHNAYFEKLGRHTSPNEVLSWKNSMMYMNNILLDAEIPIDTGVSIEFQIPLTSKRIDFILTGQDSSDKDKVIIVELKQWSTSQLTGKDAIVKTRFSHGEAETAHPSYQAWSYASMIKNYNQTVQEESIDVVPCAYLHNYEPDNVITNPFYQSHISNAPLFLKTDAYKLRAFIKTHIKYGDKKDILYKIENGRIRPSKQLADSLSSMLKGNEEFNMLDDQKVVYETALMLSNRASETNKQVLIVEGGPGTGKSVVAINLLVELTKKGKVAKYISKNAAPRAVYAEKLNGTKSKTEINNLFGGSGAFMEIEINIFDTLIVDEAHRLNEKSGLYQNLGNNQVLEIMDACKFSIFFIDDDQKIHIKDIGNKQQIQQWAIAKKMKVTTLKLSSQFRCNGSDGYLSWLDNVLQKRETANVLLSANDFDFKVFSDPKALKDEIEQKNKGNNKSRMVAGYCWDWESKKNDNIKDVKIPEFGFEMQWNLQKDGSTWIIAEDSIKEIGCIHTCQGLELDYVGVIIGDDLRYENGKVVTDVLKRSKNDNSIKGIKRMLKEDKQNALQLADQIIKNTYRTLMTRGMKGCYVYCTDEKLANHLRKGLRKDAEIVIPKIDQKKTSFRIEAEVNDEVKFIDYLPLYSLKAACGAFGEWQVVDESGWIKVDGVGKLTPNMFVVQAVGKSMEPRISDGDYCIIRANIVGSRNNKIVLVQHNEYYDSENEGTYSIKKYTSQKIYDKDTGEWMHEKIVLQPINKKYEPIVLEEDDSFMVIGEFLDTVKCDT